MDEVQAVERVPSVFDAAIHVHAAAAAGVTLDRGRLIDDGQFVAVGRNADLISGDNGYLGKQGAFRFPAFAASARMIVRGLRAYRHFNAIRRAVTVESAAGKTVAAGLNAIVDGGM